MANSLDNSALARAATLLARGQELESQGKGDAAVKCYLEARHEFNGRVPQDDEPRRLLGLIWMNLGNALQKLVTGPRLEESVQAYDNAIALFQALPVERSAACRNHLGAAWLNRGHALLGARATDAAASFEHAIKHLSRLPPDGDPSYRLNLAGAWTNLAHALLQSKDLSARDRARHAAKSALALLDPVERQHEFFGAMSLRARRMLVVAIGDLLRVTEQAGQPLQALASEATDAVDEGLALARGYESRGNTSLRPLAARLFRLGAQLYGAHQPHFLGEFLLENLRCEAFRNDEEFQTTARDALAATIESLQRPHMIVSDFQAAEKRLATLRSLRDAQRQISTFPVSA